MTINNGLIIEILVVVRVQVKSEPILLYSAQTQSQTGRGTKSLTGWGVKKKHTTEFWSNSKWGKTQEKNITGPLTYNNETTWQRKDRKHEAREETQVEHIRGRRPNHSGGKLDRKSRMTADFKIKQDVRRKRIQTSTEQTLDRNRSWHYSAELQQNRDCQLWESHTNSHSSLLLVFTKLTACLMVRFSYRSHRVDSFHSSFSVVIENCWIPSKVSSSF